MKIITGDSRVVLPTLPEKSFHCCVTSPPYFGLRDYGHDGQIGLEQTLQTYVDELVAVFREVRRVLRDDGTLWCNLGDSYNANGRVGHGGTRIGTKQGTNRASATGGDNCRASDPTLKPKDLIGIPWRVAFALQADGWYLRQDIIWHKPNPMPESVRDRCTKAHEYVFLLSKSPAYYFDHEAIKEDSVSFSKDKRAGKARFEQGNIKTSNNADRNDKGAWCGLNEKRNMRDVWTIASQAYKEAHFATFPPALVEPCILAGCPTGGMVLDPFGGAGTTGLVADQFGRDATLIELNPTYADLAWKRVYGDIEG